MISITNISDYIDSVCAITITTKIRQNIRKLKNNHVMMDISTYYTFKLKDLLIRLLYNVITITFIGFTILSTIVLNRIKLWY